jgi:mannuronan 5-epimerase
MLSAVLLSEIPNSLPYDLQSSFPENRLCIDFIPMNSTIRLTCGSATLTDIYEVMKKYKTALNGFEGSLHKESIGIWLLKSNLVVASNSSFTINSSDTKWLKIYSDGKQAYSIKVLGKMKIDSVKITSWDMEEDDYYHTKKMDSSDRRAYISVMGQATGTTNITNSELAFLGYNSSHEEEHTPSNGLSYYGGQGSEVEGNNIYNNNFGFYSAYVGGLLIENNRIHHNTYYGMDPHSGTHDMIIRNNTVHDNGKMGIICSQRCRNITIENNEVYDNVGSGISLSIDMQNSTVRNNYIYNQNDDGEPGISISESSNNKIYENAISFSDTGIKIINNSSNNHVYNNSMQGINDYSILVRGSTSVNNTLENNDMDNSKKAVRLINNTGSLLSGNDDKENTSHAREYLVQKNSTLKFEKTLFPNWKSIISDNSSSNLVNVQNSGRVIIRDTAGDITNFDTDVLPFISRINNETLSVISENIFEQ